MKKLVLTTILMSIMVSGVASANSGDVQFIGAVTDTTCNITPEIGGNLKNTIDLGTMKTDGSGTQAVEFSLVPDSKACLDKTDASVSWQSAGLNPVGLSNMKGDATGASIALIAVNSTTANQAVTSKMQNIQFGDQKNAIGEFKFKTQLVKDANAETVTAGTVLASATYAVAYK